MKYIALLRGINVGGNNKVSMTELKKCFETLGFTNVSTYINSGNVIFDTMKDSQVKLVEECEAAIEQTFGFRVVCSVISVKELHEAMAHAPSWWGNDEKKHNAIFVIAPQTTKDIMTAVGDPHREFEKIAAHDPIIFWTADVKNFGRTRYSKIVGTKAYQSVTIRNANTAKKLVALTQE